MTPAEREQIARDLVALSGEDMDRFMRGLAACAGQFIELFSSGGDPSVPMHTVEKFVHHPESVATPIELVEVAIARVARAWQDGDYVSAYTELLPLGLQQPRERAYALYCNDLRVAGRYFIQQQLRQQTAAPPPAGRVLRIPPLPSWTKENP